MRIMQETNPSITIFAKPLAFFVQKFASTLRKKVYQGSINSGVRIVFIFIQCKFIRLKEVLTQLNFFKQRKSTFQ